MPVSDDPERLLADEETRRSAGGARPSAPQLVPGLTVVYHPDLDRVGERALLPGLAAGREEPLSRREPGFAAPRQAHRRPLDDPYLSRRPVRIAPGFEPGSVRLVCGDSGTAVSADGEPVATERTFSAAEVERGVVLLLAGRIVLLLAPLDPVLPAVPRFGLVGESLGVLRVCQEIRRVARLDVPVLVLGETGTGKELVARALHEAGPRAGRPYLAVNLAAVPASLAAAELFGAARGAYTGADRPREGYFARAHGGTLFLDEIGETPAEVQPLLLRALETGEIQPVGGGDPRRVDVRLVAATDADLDQAAADGRFRAPLLHRLAGYRIEVPPLRRRREDVGRLLVHFLRRELAALGEARRLVFTPPGGKPFLPAGLVALLAAHDWPGNVRQLRNVVRRLAIAGLDAGEEEMWAQAQAALREAAGVMPAGREAGPSAPATAPRPVPTAPRRKLYRRADEVSDDELLAALRAHRWQLRPAAAQLGVSRGSLYDRIDKSRAIRKAAELGRDEIEACRERCGGDLDAMVEALEVSKPGLKRRMARLGLA